MTFDEALHELGIDRSADAELSRRAYLKLIKLRRPESDPDGFKRAREAYERVKAQLERVATPFADLVGVPAPQPARAAPPQPSAQPAAQPVVHAGAPLRPPVTPVPRTLEEFRAELASLPPGSAADAPVAVARRAVTALPEEYEPISWLVQALVGADRQDEAIPVLRAAVGKHPQALLELAGRFPSALGDQELDQLAATAPVGVLWGIVESLYQLDLGDRAAHAALLAFDLHRSQPDTPPPPPGWLGLLVLQLHLAGAPAAARKVADRYEAWIRENDLLLAFSKEPVGQAWPLVLELGRLPDDFPRLARGPLTNAIVDGGADLVRAFSELARYDPALARRCVEQLRANAPKLCAVFAEAVLVLAGDAGPSGPRPSEVSPLVVIAGVAAIVIAIFFLGAIRSVAKEMRRHDSSGRARAPIDELCSDPPEEGRRFCAEAGRAADTLDDAGCGPHLVGRVEEVRRAHRALPQRGGGQDDFRSRASVVVTLLDEIQGSCEVRR